MSDFKPVNHPCIPEDDDPNEKFPFLHTITVVDRVVSVDKPELVQNNIRTETVTLNLDSEWEGLSCLINIGNNDNPVSLIWSGQPVTIPAELMTDIGTLNVSVVGYGDDGTVRAVTKKADNMFTVVASGYVEGDEPVPDPTTILGQLVEAADNANEAADNANAAAGNANAAVERANELAGKLGDIDAQVEDARGSADAAANSAKQAAASSSAAQTSERNASNSATQASQSATAAKQSEDNAAESERNAASSAEQAANIVASVSGSVAQAENAARSASQSATAAAGSASAAGVSAQAAAGSASKAGESATAAKASETNTAASASAAKTSETNAAASATAAQQAVDGFGLQVGTTTTGEPGTDAAVSIAKQGTKYVADFTIPRGEKGEPGESGINSVLTDSTLIGDGTSGSPLGMIDGNFINAISKSGDEADANNLTANRIYKIDSSWKNMPPGARIVGGSLLDASYGNARIQCILAYTDGAGASIFIRQGWIGLTIAKWDRLVKESDLSSYVPLSTYQALEARVQALEAKLANQ